MDLISYYKDTFELLEEMIDQSYELEEYDCVSAVVSADIVIDLLKTIVLIDVECEISSIDFNICEYDKEYYFTIMNRNNNIDISISEAFYYEKDTYLSGPDGIIYIHKDVPKKYLIDINKNPFTGNYMFKYFSFDANDDDCCDCEGCPYNTTSGCLCEADDNLDELQSDIFNEGYVVSRNADGSPAGFTKTYSGEENGVSFSHSHSFYSSSIDDVIEVAKVFGVKF